MFGSKTGRFGKLFPLLLVFMNFSFDINNYDYELPEQLIARHPLARRSASKLLISKKNGDIRHQQFPSLLDELKSGDALVINDTKVFPARLQGQKASGGKIELLLSRRVSDLRWIGLINAKGKNVIGVKLIFEQLSSRMRNDHAIAGSAHSTGPSEPALIANPVRKIEGEPGAYEISFNHDPHAFALKNGSLPLPHYFGRDEEQADSNRYQTVFADDRKDLAAAAPTAGLHFDDELLDAIQAKGIELIRVTLHVGPGTFLPIRAEDIRNHEMHAEYWEISEKAANQLNHIRSTGGRIIAVGTTAVRTLESAASGKHIPAGSGETRIFIYPGYKFKVVDALITNFHLPKSSLILLVSAFAGRERVMEAYKSAIENQYRFFSYGDACFFEREGK